MINYGIVIGINHYIPPEQRGLKLLKGAIGDAEAIYKWVTTKGGVDPDNCKLILSEPPNPYKPIKNTIDEKILEIITDIKVNNKEANRLYFYFAGHGMGLPANKEENGLCMADWSELSRSNGTLSSLDYRRKFVSEGLFKEVIIWLDCCRNVIPLIDPQSAGTVIPDLGPNDNPKIFIGHAAQYSNQAFELGGQDDRDSRGIFTEVLLEKLNGPNRENGLRVTGDELRDHILYRVPERAKELNLSQKPAAYHTAGSHEPLLF